MDLKVLEIVAFLVHQIADLDLDSRQILIRWVDLIHLPLIVRHYVNDLSRGKCCNLEALSPYSYGGAGAVHYISWS